ncbi:YdbT family protein [Asanoa ferruginea]|nr:hypothetical protein [Asanoa ferruginea]
MSPITIRPRIQIAILVICFAVFLLIGTTYFNADVIAKRDWFGIILGVTIVPASLWGIWRALGLGIRIDDNGIRIRSQIDSRQRFIPWSQVESVECAAVDARAGITIHAPVLHFRDGTAPLPITGIGSYSIKAAEATTERLRALLTPPRETTVEG